MYTLYTSLIRPLLEYASPSWSPWLQKDVSKLDKVQNRCIKMCPQLADKNLESLSNRRWSQDMCEVYKYTHNLYKGGPSFFKQSNTSRGLRGHPFKLEKPRCRTILRRNFFSHRTINPWNALPTEAVSAPSLHSFKKKLRSLPIG